MDKGGKVMDDRKVIFVQVEDELTGEVAKFLGALDQTDYIFFILPASAKFLTKDDIRGLLKEQEGS